MNHYIEPSAIKLLTKEQQMYDLISTFRIGDDDYERYHEIAGAMAELFLSLCKRNAIPDIRLELFQNPNLAEKGARAPKEVFEKNGTKGENIFKHPHFIEYLHYFVNGPNLPKPVISGLCKILNDDLGTSGMQLTECTRYVRRCVRDYDLQPSSAATEFYRFCVELGVKQYIASSIRDAARQTR